MEHDDPLEALWAVKDLLSEKFQTASALAAEAARIANEEPLPPPGKTRKLIPGFPRGHSAADTDSTLEELYREKEALAKDFESGTQKSISKSPRAPAAGKPRFRSVKSDGKHLRNKR